MVKASKWFVKALLLGLIESVTAGNYSGPLVGTHMFLFTGNPTLGPDMTLATFTEANFDGYARVALTWDTYLSLPDGSAELLSILASFRSTDGTVENVITGYGVLDATTPTPNVLLAEKLPTPVGITGADMGVSIVAQVAYDGTDVGGAAFIE